MIAYKGYIGAVDLDPEIDLFHGTVINTTDVITFYGSSVTELREEMRPRGFARIGQINDLRRQLHQLLGRPVDLVVYPVTRPQLRQAIERDAVRAF